MSEAWMNPNTAKEETVAVIHAVTHIALLFNACK